MDSKIQKISDLIQKKGAKIVFFVGAGISTTCGIPDFRSPKTGLYSNLQRLHLPFPEAVFDINYFRENPKAFYTLAQEMCPGKYIPSKFHCFIRLCQDKKILKRCYTQNIDTLERIAGVKDSLIVEAHGSFAKAHCIDCHKEMDMESWKKLLKKGIPKCSKCGGYVKPDIVFFGESLPSKFFDYWEKDSHDDFDLAIVAGTSLEVYPFAMLPNEISEDTTRVLINKEICGDFEDNPRDGDMLFLHDCDTIITKLIKKLGWEDDLEKLRNEEISKLHTKKEVHEPKVAQKTESKPQTKMEKKTEKKSETSTSDLDIITKGIKNIDIKSE